jgi:nucleotide-binding universal stress UspA family protein
MAGNPFRRIIVAFDGSADSVKAVRTACSMAKEYGADLRIIHVYSIPAFTYATPAPIPQIDASVLEESAKDVATKVLERAKGLAEEADVKAQCELLESGSVVQAIVEFAENEKCDLIVVGTRGMTGFKRLILGSVSSGIISHAHCPVLVVR